MAYQQRKLTIFLADLTHTGIRIATENIPLNLGLLASYALKNIGSKNIELKLFKYPDKLLEALKDERCDVLGCSSYVWNDNLSEWAFAEAKRHNPETITIRGGWNFPLDERQQKDYLRKHVFTDIFCMYEGERPFANVIKRILGVEKLKAWNNVSLEGCVFISSRSENNFMKGPISPRIENLDEMPSPYTAGLLDDFFDGSLTPIIETARGCPFRCNYCNNANSYYSKVIFFNTEYVIEEIKYIAKKVSLTGIKHLGIADTNFGMYARDINIALALKEAQEKYNWPLGIVASTGKNNIENVLNSTDVLGQALNISMSVQSLNPQTLKVIQRDNIDPDIYKKIGEEMQRKDRPQFAEVIAPLPCESYLSYMEGVEKLLNIGAKKINSYTLQVNFGTVYKNQDFKERFGYSNRFRIIPNDFGVYDGQKVFDYEEVGVATDTLNFEDYLKIRKFALVMELAFNNSIFIELLKFLNENNINKMDFLKYVFEHLDNAHENIKKGFGSFIADTIGELKDSEESLITFYSQECNFEKLKSGEIGGNVIYKHKGIILGERAVDWITYLYDCAGCILCAGGNDKNKGIRQKIKDLKAFSTAKLDGIFIPHLRIENIVIRFKYDILSWIKEKRPLPLDNFKMRDKPFKYKFYFDRYQQSERNDLFARFGSDTAGLSKIMSRVPALERMFRKFELI